eukprot:CAMPEP_0116125834 /NCGR_PEP_ID=MMETSP0329-20121206/6016_1 /TAXON_ID=697910 /ORGANISM="Pseudo-nitzschia arenysensis, Strain B593" /LENGTH=694 /DNA_ID=CAMNT_0003619889 /DNA_START=184 /DNA_END=2265 /DNA_ORIENTATION=+
MAGMSKEAQYFIKGNQDPKSASLPPVIPTFQSASAENHAAKAESKVKVGSKFVSTSKRARPWTWAPFSSSSRSDGAMFRHWVRKHVEYTDYPYAKFDVHMDPVVYTSEEYGHHLKSETWTKSETDRLMELARIFECRWPVILDDSVWNIPPPPLGATTSGTNTPDKTSGMTSNRKMEDLQHRYYGVAAILAQLRISQEAASEARNLSVAAAKSAATTTTTAVTPTPTASSSAVATTTTSISATSTPVASAMAKQQERTDNLLLESAAARSLATTAKQHQPLLNHLGTGTSNKMFDYETEKERRHHLDRLWRRSKEEEEEEILQLRKELKTIEAQLRKLKKHGGHVLAGKTKSPSRGASTNPINSLPTPVTNVPSSSLSSSRGPSRAATPISAPAKQGEEENANTIHTDIVENPETLDEYFSSTAPVPMSQYPFLQSGRLAPPASGGPSGINKSLLTRMNEVLTEFKIPERPLPTKRVCDMYDLVRKDVLTLLTLKKMLMQREGQLQSKRLRLSRVGGSMLAAEDKVLDEERLLGISPPPKPSSSTTTGSSTAKAKTTKRKSPSAATTKTKAAAKKPAADTKPLAATTVKKKTVKRKRKAEPSKTPNAAAASSAAKAPAPGSAAAKAAKARATAAAIAAKPALASAQIPAAIPTAGMPKGPSAEAAATTPRTKASSTVAAAKTAAGSAAKRSRKS